MTTVSGLRLGQLDAECGALTGHRMLHENAPAVILLYDTLSEGEAQAPASFFGGVSGLEHIAEILAADA